MISSGIEGETAERHVERNRRQGAVSKSDCCAGEGERDMKMDSLGDSPSSGHRSKESQETRTQPAESNQSSDGFARTSTHIPTRILSDRARPGGGS